MALMKFLALFIALLAFAPTILDHGLSSVHRGRVPPHPLAPELLLTPGPTAPAPTHVFPTKTYGPSYAFNAGKAVLRVPATSVLGFHNNAGQSGSTISISTDLPFTSTGHAIVNLNRRQLEYQWVGLHHLWEIDYSWVIHGFHLLLSVLTVGTAIVRERRSYRRSLQSELFFIEYIQPEPKGTVKCQARPTRTTLLLTFPNRGLIEAGPRVPVAAPTPLEKAQQIRSPRWLVEVLQVAGSLGSCKDTVDQTVALKPPHRIIAWATICSFEGFLSLEICSANSDCSDAIRWIIVFYPRDRHCPTKTYTQPNADVTTHEDILAVLYREILSYHLWAPQLVGVVEVPGDVVNVFNTEGKPDATGIVPVSAPTPATPAQIAPNTEPETSVTPIWSTDSTSAYGTDTEGDNSSSTGAVFPPPQFTSSHEGPIFGPVNQAAAVRSQLQPVLHNLATRANQRSRALGSAEGPFENQPGADVAEGGSAIYAKEENELKPDRRRTKRGGNSETRRKRRLARKLEEVPGAGPSESNQGPLSS
ncbi:hypothetical protein FRC01_001788 [Tulasnella sp. 417]|nr:hypothetical protein FRC01_001788 [Tulasnella sp. 417]